MNAAIANLANRPVGLANLTNAEITINEKVFNVSKKLGEGEKN